jgi:uncharacterized UBP type Zn finger protein
MPRSCPHLDAVVRSAAGPRRPTSAGCEECLALGDSWVHLRTCLSCGHVGCCDSSRNKHATKHFKATTHPVMQSAEPGEDWAWCFVDSEMLPGPLPQEEATASP